MDHIWNICAADNSSHSVPGAQAHQSVPHDDADKVLNTHVDTFVTVFVIVCADCSSCSTLQFPRAAAPCSAYHPDGAHIRHGKLVLSTLEQL